MKRILRVVAGLGVGLVLGEMLASARDHGGFPHFNGYVADAVLGVRLQPDFDTTLSYLSNPPAAIHVNHQGYRGADWPADTKEFIGSFALIGDSQVFGLGVEDNQTAAALLGTLRPWFVYNLGVPTYGPDEYLAMIDEIAPRKPDNIILVLNFANDLFELGHPNTGRHVVMDGWALRGDTVPEHLDFPGRSWLFQRSHLVWAVRRLLHVEEEGPTVLSEAAGLKPAVLPTPTAPPGTVTPEALHRALLDLEEAEGAVVVAYNGVQTAPLTDANAAVYALRRGAQVGDIVNLTLGEESEQRVMVTAGWLRAAATLSRDAPAKLAGWLKDHPKEAPSAEARAVLQRYDKAREAYDALGGDHAMPVVLDPERRSAFRGFLAQAALHAARAGASLTVAALPMDIQVSAEEFKKYGEQPQDMSGTLSLLSDLCRDAAHLGLRCLDASEALRAAEPGAFLDGDLHMTPKGQAAFAAALAEISRQPRPDPVPVIGLPPGRSAYPDPIEWTRAEDAAVTGATRNHCRARQVREYLHVFCTSAQTGLTIPPPMPLDPNAPAPIGFDAESTYGARLLGARAVDSTGESVLLSYPDCVSLTAPLVPGRTLRVDFTWTDRVERLVVQPGANPLGAFEARPFTPLAELPAEGVQRGCPPEEIKIGAFGGCVPLCSKDIPGYTCVTGTCSDWLGFPVCL